jgi:hypothetical protein
MGTFRAAEICALFDIATARSVPAGFRHRCSPLDFGKAVIMPRDRAR